MKSAMLSAQGVRVRCEVQKSSAAPAAAAPGAPLRAGRRSAAALVGLSLLSLQRPARAEEEDFKPATPPAKVRITIAPLSG